MSRTVRFALGVLVVCALLGGAVSVGTCQGIESYAFVHPFGLSSATTARQFGMGGPISCVWDEGFANPAFAATQKAPNAGLRVSSTDFDRGPEVVTEHAHYILPLRENVSGLQFSVLNLDSNVARVVLPGMGPGLIELSERDLSIQYGHRLTPKLTGGIALTPYSETKFSLATAGGFPVMDIESEFDVGGRLGLAYEWAPGDFLGIVYDYYQETATATGLAVGGQARRVFHSELLAIGASRHLQPDLLAVVEYRTSSTFDGPTKRSLSGWHAGLEFQPSAPCALRAGLDDENLTLGSGYKDDRWQVDYAFVSDWNDDIAGNLFGGSDTHQLQATYRW